MMDIEVRAYLCIIFDTIADIGLCVHS